MTPGTEIEGIRLLNIQGNIANFSIQGDLYKISTGQITVVSTSTFARPRDPESNGIVIHKGNSARKIREISIPADRKGRYFIMGTINSVPIRFQIDTGADTIAMSRSEGARIGLPVEKGIRGTSTTASGTMSTFNGSCQEVTVGPITLNHVMCSVSEKPDNSALNQATLLGNSFLRRITMHQENGVLTLSQAY